MTHMSPADEHDFTKPDGSHLGDDDLLAFAPGIHENMLQNAQYQAKKQADGASYVWDRLIEAFTTHMLAGTTILPDGQVFDLFELEQGIRHMALVPRYLRRLMGEAILDALEKGRTADRFTRAFLPGPTEANQETAFFFMTLAPPKFILDGGYQQYRVVRHNMLQSYAFALLQKHPKLKRVVGIATEPPGNEGTSEDLLVVEDIRWTEELLKDLEERKAVFNIMQARNFTEYAIQGNEFPEIAQSESVP